MFKNLASKLKDFLKPIGLRIAVKIVQREGDNLQAQVKEAVAKKCEDQVDQKIDAWQERLIKSIAGVGFLPEGIKEKAERIVQECGDKLQAKLQIAICNGGPGAIDAAFDSVQEHLIERIQAL